MNNASVAACPACGLPPDHAYHVDHPGGAQWRRYDHDQLLAVYEKGRADQLADDVRFCEEHGAFIWAEPRPCTCRRAGCALIESPQVPVAPLLKENAR